MKRKSLAWRLYFGLMTVATIKTAPNLLHPGHVMAFLTILAGIIAWLGLLAYVNGLAAGPPLFWRIFATVFACGQAVAIAKGGMAARAATRHPNPAVGYASAVLAIALMLLLAGPTVLACLRLGGLFLRDDEKPDDYRTVFA